MGNMSLCHSLGATDSPKGKALSKAARTIQNNLSKFYKVDILHACMAHVSLPWAVPPVGSHFTKTGVGVLGWPVEPLLFLADVMTATVLGCGLGGVEVVLCGSFCPGGGWVVGVWGWVG